MQKHNFFVFLITSMLLIQFAGSDFSNDAAFNHSFYCYHYFPLMRCVLCEAGVVLVRLFLLFSGVTCLEGTQIFQKHLGNIRGISVLPELGAFLSVCVVGDVFKDAFLTRCSSSLVYLQIEWYGHCTAVLFCFGGCGVAFGFFA